MNKSIILMSGGLDSLVSLGYVCLHTDYNVQMALTFDYGQKAVKEEIEASKKISEFYNIEHKVIKLDWLKDITKTSLVADVDVPNNDFKKQTTSDLVWVPNRNSLFLNIAACFCDSFEYNYIIFGANKEEANKFSDNTELFRKKISKCFLNSTQVKPTVIAPLINSSKDDIVKMALRDSMPLQYVRSCYNSGEKHCGNCESCYYLKRALISNNCEEYLKILFYDEN